MNPHSNKLLDMLKSTASQPATAPPPALSPPEGSPREPSPLPPPPSLQAVSLQDLFANISPPTSPPNQESHRSSLLGMLQSIGTSSETPSPGKDQPISDVSTQYGSIAPPEKPFQPNEPVINHPQSPPAESTQPPHPTKSMFDFVSPFDVFDRAKKPQPKASPSPAPVKSSPKVTAPAQEVPPPRDPSPLPKPQSGQEARQRKPSSSSHQASKGLPQTPQPPQLPHLLSSVVPKGTTGNGPAQAEANITIDISQPNIDHLIGTPGAVQIIPTTIMKAESTLFTPNRSVGITAGWLAYVLTKGRVRLIDSTSGARLVLQLPEATGILDLAVIPDRVAVVGSDHSVTVFSVPTEWQKDNPPCDVITHIQYDASSLGQIDRVEWLRKSGEDHLAIGGDAGVIIIRPEKGELNISDLERTATVLKTEGTVAGFCINHSNQAIGVLSTKSHFTLYNVSNSLRVWNRPLPTSSPTSINFVESNLLIGRENNTIYDLVQITGETAVVSSISFTGQTHFTQPIYDATRNILWVSVFGRGSLFGFRYALKGQPPIRVSERGPVTAFDKVAELPLEPVLSLSFNPKATEFAEFFFATPGGFSMAHVEKPVCDNISSNPAPPEVPKAPQAKASPPAVKQELSEEHLIKTHELSKMFKKSEDKMNTNLKQSLARQMGQIETRLDAMSEGVAEQITTKVKSAVESEMQRFSHSTTLAVQHEIQSAVTSAFSGAVTQMERNLGPSIQRSVATAAQASVDLAIQKAIAATLLPAIAADCQRMGDRILREVKSEMLQARKEDNSDTIRSLASAVHDLQRQVASMGASRASPPAAAPPANLEDTFLNALSAQNTPAVLALIGSNYAYTDAIFPSPPARSALSQAITLSLLHRLSQLLQELHPSDPAFGRALRWAQKTSALLDPRSPDIASFYPRVCAVVNGSLGGVLHSLASNPSQLEAANGVRVVLDTLAQKA